MFLYFNKEPIFIAIKRNRLDVVKIISSQKSFNFKATNDNIHPLYYAVIKDKIEIVKFMLSDNRFLTYQFYKHKNLFEYAIWLHFFDLAEILIQNPKVKLLSEKPKGKNKFSYERNKFFYNRDEYEMNLFHFLYEKSKNENADKKKKEIIHSLLRDNSYTQINQLNKYIQLPLATLFDQKNMYSSFKSGQTDEISYLNLIYYFIKNSNLNDERKKREIMKNKALFTCIASRYLNETEFIQFLDDFEVANINQTESKTEVTPLLSSIMNIKYDTLKIILTRYKDDVDYEYICKLQKITSLHLICCKTSSELQEGDKMFLNMNDLDYIINVQDKKYLYAPLHLAVLNCNYEAVSILVKNKDTDVNIQDKEKNTPLHLALLHERPYFSFILKESNFIKTLKCLLNEPIKKINTKLKNNSVFIRIFRYIQKFSFFKNQFIDKL